MLALSNHSAWKILYIRFQNIALNTEIVFNVLSSSQPKKEEDDRQTKSETDK